MNDKICLTVVAADVNFFPVVANEYNSAAHKHARIVKEGNNNLKNACPPPGWHAKN